MAFLFTMVVVELWNVPLRVLFAVMMISLALPGSAMLNGDLALEMSEGAAETAPRRAVRTVRYLMVGSFLHSATKSIQKKGM